MNLKGLFALIAGGVYISKHSHEKRHGGLQDTRALSCAIARCTHESRRHEPPLLWYEMQFSFCIVCNTKHWILGERIEPTFVDREAAQIPDPAMRRAFLYYKGSKTNKK